VKRLTSRRRHSGLRSLPIADPIPPPMPTAIAKPTEALRLLPSAASWNARMARATSSPEIIP